MKVIAISKKSGYSLSTSKFFEFKRFSESAGDFVLIEGGFEKTRQWEQFDLSPQQLQEPKMAKLRRQYRERLKI